MHSSSEVSWLIWLLLAIVIIWLGAEFATWRKKQSKPAGGAATPRLHFNRWMLPVLAIGVIIGAAANTLLQDLQHSYSFINLAFIFLVSVVSGTGLVSIFGYAAARFPRLGGALLLILLAGLGIDFMRASFSGDPHSFPDNTTLLILMLSSLVLYGAACVMLVFARRATADDS